MNGLRAAAASAAAIAMAPAEAGARDTTRPRSPAPPRNAWARAEPAGTGAVRVAIESSSSFPRSETAPTPDRLESNMLMGAGRLSEIKKWSVEGRALVGRTNEPLEDGDYLFQFALRPRLATLAADAFTRYLRQEDGLAAALRERSRLKETELPGNERSTTLGKALVHVGAAGTAPPELAGAGMLYDLVPASDPTKWTTGHLVEVRAIYDGKPALARTVHLSCAGSGQTDIRAATTDVSGVARLKVPRGRRCMLSSVDMRRLEGDVHADWESVFTTFTFERLP